MQSSRNAELKLLLGLRSSSSLKYLGCRFDRGLVGGVTVTMADHPLGAWWYDKERYSFSTIAYRPSRVNVRTVNEAREKTKQLATSMMVRETVDREDN